MRPERVPQYVTPGQLRHPGLPDRFFYRPSQNRFKKMVPLFLAGLPIDIELAGRHFRIIERD